MFCNKIIIVGGHSIQALNSLAVIPTTQSVVDYGDGLRVTVNCGHANRALAITSWA